MSALTDLFSSMANKIRSKTGTATTYTPSEMASDGIDDVYDAGVASATTSITPSNASPVSMTANTGYKPTVNGYAISSYNNVTPSDSSPIALTSGEIDKMGGNGYAIQSYSSVNPSNLSPVTLSSGSIYKMSGNGKAVASIASKTPSDSNPPPLSTGFIYTISGIGYLVENIPVNLLAPNKIDQANYSSSGSKTITVTQKPRLVIFSHSRYGNNEGRGGVVICDITNQKAIIAKYGGDGYSYDLDEPYSNWIGTVSSTSIQIKNPNTVTYRGHVLIYY